MTQRKRSALLSDDASSLPFCEAAPVRTGFAVGTTTQLCLRTRTLKFALLLMDALSLEEDAAAHQAFKRKRGIRGKRKEKKKETTTDEAEATVM